MDDKEKETSPSEVQDLVIFKTKIEYEREEKDKYLFESIDQEDKIKLEYDFKPFSGHYLYAILLSNQSLAPITDVKIKIKYPEFLTLTRCTPPTIHVPPSVEQRGSKQINLEFDEFNENSKKQINLHFAPLSLKHVGELRAIITYVNNKDFVRVLNSEPVEIRINKLNITPKIIPSFQLKKILQIPGIKKAIKSFGVGSPVDLDIYFNIIEQILRAHNFQLIAKDLDNKIIWYLGTDLESGEDILLIGQIVINKVEVISASQNHQVIISILTQISNDFKERVLRRGIIPSIDHIFDLECKYCGAVLPYFPKKGEHIECEKCKYGQIVW
ncbi:MAG: hypothetical protein ACFFAO_09535 [Candidatus Hermodarchaeota archaeon]